MFLGIDRLQIELPQPTRADPSSAAALQDQLGGKFGEMSTLNNYFDGHPDGGKIPDLAGISAAFTPDYQPEEIYETPANSTRPPSAE